MDRFHIMLQSELLKLSQPRKISNLQSQNSIEELIKAITTLNDEDTKINYSD